MATLTPAQLRKLAKDLHPNAPPPRWSVADWQNAADALEQYARLLETPRTVWIITTESDDGNEARGYASEEAFNQAYRETVAACWKAQRMVQPMPEDPHDAYEVLTGTPGFLDWISYHQVEVQP